MVVAVEQLVLVLLRISGKAAPSRASNVVWGRNRGGSRERRPPEAQRRKNSSSSLASFHLPTTPTRQSQSSTPV